MHMLLEDMAMSPGRPNDSFDDLAISPVRPGDAFNCGMSQDKENSDIGPNCLGPNVAAASDEFADIKSLAAELGAIEEEEEEKQQDHPESQKDVAAARMDPPREFALAACKDSQGPDFGEVPDSLHVDKSQKRHKSSRRVSMTSAAGGWRLKYDSALQQIGELQSSNTELQKEVSKLKLSLALKEADFVTMQETPQRVRTERKPPLPPRSAASKSAMPARSRARRAQMTESVPKTEFTKPHTRRRDDRDNGEDYTELFHDLIESESFQLVGSGESVLDQLSEQCRRDVVIRYCDMLDAISGAMR